MKFNKTLLILLLSAITALTGCAVSVQPPTAYSLTEVPNTHAVRAHGSSILMVLTPVAAPYYRTTLMAYEMEPHQISYFSRNAWAQPPAQMLQPLLVKTLQNTNRFRAVVSPPVTGFYDYMLNTEIVTLRVNQDMKPVTYQVTLRAQVFNAKSNRAIATKNITVYEPINGCSFYSRVLAANHAVAKALAQVSQFTLRTIR